LRGVRGKELCDYNLNKVSALIISPDQPVLHNKIVDFTEKLYFCTMKRCVSFLLPLLLVFVITSCQFSRLMKSDDPEKKFAKAVEYYNKKDYSHAMQLFDQLMSVMRATDKAQKIYYFYAYCYYGQKDYTLASYYFKRYVTNFPNTKEAEECAFMSAYCTSLNSPEYSLDQTTTFEALKELQLFANTYPKSTRVPECNDIIDKLRVKLEYKDYNVAKMYYTMKDYAASIRSLNNILKEYPETPHKEEILYLVYKSWYSYAKQSVEEKKKERYQKTIASCNDFIQQFPEGHFAGDAKDLKVKSQAEIELLKKKNLPSQTNIIKLD
jgi:outer membrane protein assembly factor BamD